MKQKTHNQPITGTFTGNTRGFGFVTSNAPVETECFDIFIPEKQVNGALHGDTVLCLIDPPDTLNPRNGSGRRVGRVLEIIKRGHSELVGTFHADEQNRVYYITALEQKIPGCFYISAKAKKALALVDGHRVTFRVDARQSDPFRPRAEILEILGHMNDPGVDVLSIVRQYGVPYEFPEAVLSETAFLPDAVSEAEIKDRLDLRETPAITIDGEDTKDIDDAVSLRVTPEGFFELGVHIADVAHYVREGTPLDAEAIRRGTSIYPADRVIPMLPPKLSNGICSLNPGEDRLTLSCLMTVDPGGRVVSHSITPSVIRSQRKFTYTRVQEMLDTVDAKLELESEAEWLPTLLDMERLRQILRAKRINRGALEFNFPETKIQVDVKGWPVSITPRERSDATGMIEEFMILCNETVAEHFFWLEAPFAYRTHEEPEPEKIRQLSVFTRSLGYTLRGNGQNSGALQQLLTKTEGVPEETIIHQTVLRSLKQARYTPENRGHYGLAAKYYCHFTAPIRRYPDLQIQRIIKEQQAGFGDERTQHYRDMLPEVCRNCSRTERTAESLEREVEQLKKVQYMLDQEGRVFDGLISGITPWGLYVMLPSTVEGLIPVEHLRSVGFTYDEKNQCYANKKETLRPGSRARVMLERADLEERKLWFVLAEDRLYL